MHGLGLTLDGVDEGEVEADPVDLSALRAPVAACGLSGGTAVSSIPANLIVSASQYSGFFSSIMVCPAVYSAMVNGPAPIGASKLVPGGTMTVSTRARYRLGPAGRRPVGDVHGEGVAGELDALGREEPRPVRRVVVPWPELVSRIVFTIAASTGVPSDNVRPSRTTISTVFGSVDLDALRQVGHQLPFAVRAQQRAVDPVVDADVRSGAGDGRGIPFEAAT